VNRTKINKKGIMHYNNTTSINADFMPVKNRNKVIEDSDDSKDSNTPLKKRLQRKASLKKDMEWNSDNSSKTNKEDFSKKQAATPRITNKKSKEERLEQRNNEALEKKSNNEDGSQSLFNKLKNYSWNQTPILLLPPVWNLLKI
jgi:hypothetical protein